MNQRRCYTVCGALFGLCFPIIGTLLEAYLRLGTITPSALAEVQASEPLLWIINTAPFFLGVFAGMAGARQDRADALNLKLERLVKGQRAVENVMIDLLYVVDTEGRLVKWNRRLEQITGLDAKTLRGCAADTLFVEEDRPAVRAAIAKAVAHGLEGFEAHLDTPSGPVLYEWNGTPLLEDGRPVGMAGTGRDISERKAMHDALASSEREYRGLFDHVHDAILVIDPEGETVLRANARAGALYGLSADELVGQSMQRFSSPHAPDHARAMMTSDDPVYRFETVQRRTDGALMHLEVNAVRIEIEGRPAILSVNRDITDRVLHQATLQAAKDSAEASDRLKSTILQNVGHEMRTPLAEIIGWAQVIAEETAGAPQEFAGYVQSSAQRLVRSLDSLIELARLESDGPERPREPVPVGPLLRRLASECWAPAQAKRLQLWIDADDDLIALADPDGLHRVLLHLLDNAIRYTEHGGVFVRTRREGETAVITVRDTGIGMSAEFLAGAFTPFVQASTGETRRHEGLGLGLSVVQRLTQAMGGTISVRSEVGRGTEFRVVLPLAGADESDAAPPRPLRSERLVGNASVIGA